VRLGQLNPHWPSSLMIGITTKHPEYHCMPNTALVLKENSWIIAGDSVFHNGFKSKCHYGPNLDSLQDKSGGNLVGIVVDIESRLHLLVNGIDQGVAATEIPSNVYVVIDVFGKCQEVHLQKPQIFQSLLPNGQVQNYQTTCVQNDQTTCVQNDQTTCVQNDQTKCVQNDQMTCVQNDKTTCFQNDKTTCVQNDKTTCVQNDQTKCVQNDQTKCVQNDQTTCVENDQATCVQNDQTTCVQNDQMMCSNIGRSLKPLGYLG
ncbi:unnamed protein product, partial [Meganyctiphanes norvegica]